MFDKGLVPAGGTNIINSGNSYSQMLSIFEQTIREECKGVYIAKAQTLFDLEFYDHAVLEYWNRAMTDLKDKLTIYGLEHFPSELKQNVKARVELSTIRDFQIIEACSLLGIIDDEAEVFLKHCLNVRNNFSAAHDTENPIDPIESLNLIKNCVKYVLQKDVPSPAMTINELLTYIQSPNFDSTHFDEIVIDQSPKVVESFVRRIFNEYIDPTTIKDYRDNLKMIISTVWNMIGEEVKSDLGSRLLQLKLEDEVDKSLYAMDFMIKVEGIKYIPMAVRKHIFIKKSKELLKAHYGLNNFYAETPQAQGLLALGFNIPDEALEDYVNAIIFSFTGNSWGYSHDASPHNQAMIENLSTKGVEQLLVSLKTDTAYAWHFTSVQPVRRIKVVLETLKGKSNLLPKHNTAIESYLKMKSLRDHFTQLTDVDDNS